MITGIDHLVIATADPDEAARTLERELGLRAEGGGRHGALGTFNTLVWFGDSYLELLGVFDRSLAARSWLGAPALRALDAGGGFLTWAVASDDLEGDLERCRAAGAPFDGPLPGERLRADGEVARWRLGVPARLGPADPPFLIEHDSTSAEWRPEDRATRASASHPIGGPVRLDGLELPVPDLAAAAAAFERAGIGLQPAPADGAMEARFGRGTVRLVAGADPATAAALPIIGLSVGRPGRQTVSVLLGCRFVIDADR